MARPPAGGDHDDAVRLANEAGALLVELRRGIGVDIDQDQARTLGDRRSHELLMARLAESHPGDAVLSEEGERPTARPDNRRIWIVDPLDGTREFGEPPRTDWAVHVALVEDHELAAGAVALPAQEVTLSTAAPPPAPPNPPAHPRILVSRSRPPAWAEDLAGAMDGVLVPLGSAGAKIAAVIRGEADVYVHAGGQYEWDSAAPVAVARSAGLHTSRIDGSALVYNRPDPWLPDILVCHPSLASAVLDLLPRLLPSPQ
jgi:3'(2'), 5'-bisphosphate nucleotidase